MNVSQIFKNRIKWDVDTAFNDLKVKYVLLMSFYGTVYVSLMSFYGTVIIHMLMEQPFKDGIIVCSALYTSDKFYSGRL